MASSISQSSMVEPRGFWTSSFGPQSEVTAFENSTGSVGIGLFVSIAWSV